MRRVWAGWVQFVERMTMIRVLLALDFLAILGICLLALSVLAESEPLQQQPPPSGPTLVPTAVAIVSTRGATPPTATATPLSPTPLPVATDDLNILLLGTDRRRSSDPTWRTDTIIVVAVRPRAQRIGMFSIPRDLWVSIPGYGWNRINVVDYVGEKRYGAGGGPRLLRATLQENLHIPIHAYVRINFVGLERIIDALGGITVQVDRPFDEWMDGSSTGSFHLQLAPGVQHMDGQTAVGYARSRRHSDDLDRSRRQQQVLLAIRDAALRPAVLPQIPKLLAALSGTVDTDLRPNQVLSLIGLACQLGPNAYRTRVCDRTMVRDWITPGGAMVLLPNRARIEQAWAELTK